MEEAFDNKTALVLVDIQKGFEEAAYWGGGRNNPHAEEKAGELLAFWRKNSWPIFHVKHCSTTPASPLVEGKPGNEIQEVVKPKDDEPVIKKSVNSVFIGTDLEKLLREEGVRKMVFVGLTTDHCVSTSVRMSANLGFETFVVSDATATFDKVGTSGQHFSAELIHETALASLSQEFAEVVRTDDILTAKKNP